MGELLIGWINTSNDLKIVQKCNAMCIYFWSDPQAVYAVSSKRDDIFL